MTASGSVLSSHSLPWELRISFVFWRSYLIVPEKLMRKVKSETFLAWLCKALQALTLGFHTIHAHIPPIAETSLT